MISTKTTLPGHPWLRAWWRWGASVHFEDRAGEQYALGDCTDEYVQAVVVMLARAAGADVNQAGETISYQRPPLWRRLVRAIRGA